MEAKSLFSSRIIRFVRSPSDHNKETLTHYNYKLLFNFVYIYILQSVGDMHILTLECVS